MSTLTFPAPSSHIVTQRLRIMEFTLDHEAPYFSNMRRRTSRKACACSAARCSLCCRLSLCPGRAAAAL
jgi:hypothetical protein